MTAIAHREDVPKYDYKSADRVNAPTVEAAARLGADETADRALPESDERKKWRYPKLVWNSEDNGEDKASYGPLYIHDKVDPYVFVQSLFGDKNPGVAQYGFEATNGFRDEKGEPAFDPNWYPYRYKGNWSNRLIRATGQRAMASLLYNCIRRTCAGR